MQKVWIGPIHIESLPSSTHYRWMLKLLSLGMESCIESNESSGEVKNVSFRSREIESLVLLA